MAEKENTDKSHAMWGMLRDMLGEYHTLKTPGDKTPSNANRKHTSNKNNPPRSPRPDEPSTSGCQNITNPATRPPKKLKHRKGVKQKRWSSLPPRRRSTATPPCSGSANRRHGSLERSKFHKSGHAKGSYTAGHVCPRPYPPKKYPKKSTNGSSEVSPNVSPDVHLQLPRNQIRVPSPRLPDISSSLSPKSTKNSSSDISQCVSYIVSQDISPKMQQKRMYSNEKHEQTAYIPYPLSPKMLHTNITSEFSQIPSPAFSCNSPPKQSSIMSQVIHKRNNELKAPQSLPTFAFAVFKSTARKSLSTSNFYGVASTHINATSKYSESYDKSCFAKRTVHDSTKDAMQSTLSSKKEKESDNSKDPNVGESNINDELRNVSTMNALRSIEPLAQTQITTQQCCSSYKTPLNIDMKHLKEGYEVLSNQPKDVGIIAAGQGWTTSKGQTAQYKNDNKVDMNIKTPILYDVCDNIMNHNNEPIHLIRPKTDTQYTYNMRRLGNKDYTVPSHKHVVMETDTSLHGSEKLTQTKRACHSINMCQTIPTCTTSPVPNPNCMHSHTIHTSDQSQGEHRQDSINARRASTLVDRETQTDRVFETMSTGSQDKVAPLCAGWTCVAVALFNVVVITTVVLLLMTAHGVLRWFG